MKAFLIARVSTLDQSDALPGQIYRLKDYAARNSFDYELFELKESAYSGQRSSFKQVIDLATKSDEKIAIVFDKIDRLTRRSNSREVETLYDLAMNGSLELHFVSDWIILNAESSSNQKFIFNIGIAGSQNYSDNISDNVKRRNMQKWRDGEWCGMAPIGYININLPNEKKWIVQDDRYSHVIKETFELYATGNYSMALLAKMWREEYDLIRTGPSKIDQVLKNPFYYGEMRVKDKIYPHKYEPIITRALFEKVKDVLNGYKVAPRRWGGLPFPYRGLIRCAECGCRITFETKKNKYVYGHCTRKKNKHPLKYVNQDNITIQVMDILKEIQIPDEAFIQVSNALEQSQRERHNDYKQKLSLLRSEISKYKSRKDKLFEGWMDGKVSEEYYEQKYKEFDLKIQLNEEKLKSLELIDNDQLSSIAHLLDLARKAPQLFQRADIQQKRSLLNLVVSNFELDDDLLRWEYKKPFREMAFCKKNSNWLRRLDSNQRPID